MKPPWIVNLPEYIIKNKLTSCLLYTKSELLQLLAPFPYFHLSPVIYNFGQVTWVTITAEGLPANLGLVDAAHMVGTAACGCLLAGRQCPLLLPFADTESFATVLVAGHARAMPLGRDYCRIIVSEDLQTWVAIPAVNHSPAGSWSIWKLRCLFFCYISRLKLKILFAANSPSSGRNRSVRHPEFMQDMLAGAV